MNVHIYIYVNIYNVHAEDIESCPPVRMLVSPPVAPTGAPNSEDVGIP